MHANLEVYALLFQVQNSYYGIAIVTRFRIKTSDTLYYTVKDGASKRNTVH